MKIDGKMYRRFSRWELSFINIDECTTNSHNCDVNAVCNNTEGSHNCTCKPGYSGDGSNCTGNGTCFNFFFVSLYMIEVYTSRLNFVIGIKSVYVELVCLNSLV